MTTLQDPADIFLEKLFLGSGSFGNVFKAENRVTKQEVAIKVVDLDVYKLPIDKIINEVSILSSLRVDQCTKYYGSYLRGTFLWIVLEFCGGGACSEIIKA
jgi:serine/threonine protein kinase